MLVIAFVCLKAYLCKRYVITCRLFNASVDHYAAVARLIMLKMYNIVAFLESKFNCAAKIGCFFPCSGVNLLILKSCSNVIKLWFT
jgi:hypothetical protein